VARKMFLVSKHTGRMRYLKFKFVFEPEELVGTIFSVRPHSPLIKQQTSHKNKKATQLFHALKR